MNITMITSCSMSAVLRRAFPTAISPGVLSGFAARAAPLAVKTSTKIERPRKVVMMRPGWMGEWWGM